MRPSSGGSRLDREVRELLRDDPELLAVAELIASLPSEDVDSEARTERGSRGRLSSAVRALLSKTRRRRSS
jgi:hypothetical protein